MSVSELKKNISLTEDEISELKKRNLLCEEKIAFMMVGMERKQTQMSNVSIAFNKLKNDATDLKISVRGKAAQTILEGYETLFGMARCRTIENKYEKIIYCIKANIDKLKNEIYENTSRIRNLQYKIDMWNSEMGKARLEEMFGGGAK